MSWHPAMQYNYMNNNFAYNSAGSYVNFFEGLAYEHANFIFSDALHAQENMYPAMHTNFYKFGLSEPGGVSYYDYSYVPVLSDHMPNITDYNRHLGNSSTITNDRSVEVHPQWGDNSNLSVNSNHVECPRGHHNVQDHRNVRDHNNVHDHQVVWQDDVDPDNMTYEELLELGEAVGTQSRGLPQDLISMLPVRKFKCGFFSRKKSRDERCVICQMEYKRGNRQIILPCKHAYHAGCGTKWLSINKACPICYTEVFGGTGKQ